jgi:hypothetical protein
MWIVEKATGLTWNTPYWPDTGGRPAANGSLFVAPMNASSSLSRTPSRRDNADSIAPERRIPDNVVSNAPRLKRFDRAAKPASDSGHNA